MSTTSIAANAYASAARMLSPAAAQRSGGEGTGFGDMLRNAVQSVGQTARTTDQRTQAMAAGRADLIDVVTAVAETEVAVESLVAVRDKVVQAYEEIMRMQI
ncbi:flagellar hook-basal body complex protein FliE [Phreatobacter sp.]|uniref:flagellar hook-basal body complex protein FliE n=1 Tax=Phreatobacter sp. TaxID=1966341 RepID=UPI003F71143C